MLSILESDPQKGIGFWGKGKESKNLLVLRGQLREVETRTDQAAVGKKKGYVEVPGNGCMLAMRG